MEVVVQAQARGYLPIPSAWSLVSTGDWEGVTLWSALALGEPLLAERHFQKADLISRQILSSFHLPDFFFDGTSTGSSMVSISAMAVLRAGPLLAAQLCEHMAVICGELEEALRFLGVHGQTVASILIHLCEKVLVDGQLVPTRR